MFRLIPERQSLPLGQDCDLRVLLRAEVEPPALTRHRRPLDLVLVLDALQDEREAMARRAVAAFQVALQDQDRFTLLTSSSEGDPFPEFLSSLKDWSGSREHDLLRGWLRALQQLRGSRLPERRIVMLGGAYRWSDKVRQAVGGYLTIARHQGIVTSGMGFLQEHTSLAEEAAQLGGGNYYRLEQRSPLADLVALELSGQPLCPVNSLEVRVECPDGVDLTWVTRPCRWEPLDCYRPVQKLMRLRVPATHQGALLCVRCSWTRLSDGQRQQQDLSLTPGRVSLEEWAAEVPEPEVEAQSLRLEFLQLVFGWTRWWEDGVRRARLSEVLQADCLPPQERKAMSWLADLSPRKTILDADIADRLNGDFDIFFSLPAWTPRVRTPQMDELERMKGQLSSSQRYVRQMAINRRFDHEIPPRPWERVEGMLVGLSQGETASLNFLAAYLATVQPGQVFRDWQAREIAYPSPAFARVLAGNGLARVAVTLLPYCQNPQLQKMSLDIAAIGLLSEPCPDVALGVAHLLWQAMLLPCAPKSEWYRTTFLAHPKFEDDRPLWQPITDWGWLTDTSPLSQTRALVRSWLSLLEKHGDDPGLDLSQFPADLAGLLGAALGAIHGPQPGWPRNETLHALVLERWPLTASTSANPETAFPPV